MIERRRLGLVLVRSFRGLCPRLKSLLGNALLAQTPRSSDLKQA